MCRSVLELLILVALGCLSSAEDASCPEPQRAFQGSCFEFVAHHRSFVGAQAWCEESGGHLAFIPDENTQYFLQKLLDPQRDMWIGVARAASLNVQYSATAEGPLSWLDDSHITFSNWASSPEPGAACGHILKHSGFQWEATGDCDRELSFMCQFESRRAIVCAGQNIALQCASGQVLVIDGGFYGRKNVHYCQSTSSTATISSQQCGWVNVVESLKALCQGRQVCLIAEAVKSFGEPCPPLGNYLSVDYHCEEGFTLTMNTVAAVFTDVTIIIKWLLTPSRGKPLCRLSTGDGHVFHVDSPAGLESRVIHRYTYPSTCVVAVECTSDDMHVTSQKIITILEPVTDIRVTSVTPEMVEQLRPGCHQLTISASNMVTFPEVSTELQRNKHLRVVRDKDSTSDSIKIEAKPKVPVDSKEKRIELSIKDSSSFNDPGERYQWECRGEEYEMKKYTIKIGDSVLTQPPATVTTAAAGVTTAAPPTTVPVTISATPNPGTTISATLNTGPTIIAKPNPGTTISATLNPGPTIIATPNTGTPIIATPNPGTTIIATLNPGTTISATLNTGPTISATPNPGTTIIAKPNPGTTISATLNPGPTIIATPNTGTTIIAKPNPGTTISATLNPGPTIIATPNPGTTIIATPNPGTPIIATPNPGTLISATPNPGPTIIATPNPGTTISATPNPGPTISATPNPGPTIIATPNPGPTIIATPNPGPTIIATPNPGTTISATLNPGPTIIATPNPGTTISATLNPGPTIIATPNPGTTIIATLNPGTTIIATPNTATESNHLRCSDVKAVAFVFLPLGDSSNNYNLIITATVKKDNFVASTTIKAQVLDSAGDSGTSVDDLKSTVENVVAQLKKQGLLSGETIGQIIGSVSDKLSSQSGESGRAEREQLREQMLHMLTDAVKEVPIKTPQEVQVVARSLTAVISKEVNSTAQEEASLLFVNLSSSLLLMDVNNSEESKKEMQSAASTILEGASNILDNSSNGKNVSDALLVVLNNIQSALLIHQTNSKGPTVIWKNNIGVYVNRVTPGSLHMEPLTFPNCSYPSFSLPILPSNIFPSDESVDLRMLSLDKNPFSWNEGGNISGQIVSLSLTRQDGSAIHLQDLSEDVEIMLPTPVGGQVNTSVLDLGNYSTMIIDIPSADSTLVIKMLPSEDPLPFKLLLGYMSYPTEESYVAMTEMPQEGKTQEERYTWLVDAEKLKMETGVHYLVVRPIVGPGIKSINATLSIISISVACKFWNASKLEWSGKGCRVGAQTTHLVTQCFCNHLTFFGSSFFVTPNLVDASRTAELFGTFAENPVVVCFVGSLFVAYLLVVVWARRKDIQDAAKVRGSVLEDNDPMDEYRYLLCVSTGHRRGASTSSQITLTLLGADGNSEPHHLTDPKKSVFERGAVDMFLLTTPFSLGELQGVRLWHDNSGSHPAWYVGHVMVQDGQTDQKWHFLCNSWLAIDMGDCSLDKVVSVSTETDLKSFSNLFYMKTTKDLSDGHLWYSVISRPPSSTFTCVQRVSCCFSLLLCTMLTSIMFYGIPTDPSEQTMDLGHFEFTWQQFMVGVQSSLIMFPVNILIVGIFRNTRPRETSCCGRRAEQPDAGSSQTGSTEMNGLLTLDSITKDIKRILRSFSKSMKSNIPSAELGPGQPADIHALLSVLKDYLRQIYKTGDEAESSTEILPDVAQPQEADSESGGSVHPVTDVEGVQKSNRTRYLYRQMCHINRALGLLGSSGFPSPHSYSRALQQVQGMKVFLEDQLLASSSTSPDEPAQNNDDGQKKKKEKKGCCHGGLPWWFIFVGWLLVIATSSVAGFYTMLYGLKFGKDRSCSWLVSMIVSFFQSILIIQPLKVLCLAAYFALVIKKVDEEDFQNVAFDSKAGKKKLPTIKSLDQQSVRQGRSLYEPPPPGDVERMKRIKMIEQKAFALFREIFIYTGFMWMLLLVAYGQRDPNAFHLNQHIRNSFSPSTSQSMSLRDVFTWANTSLLSNLFGDYPGFITDGNSKLVGNARLRQLRVKKSSCQIAGSMLHLVPDCHAPYSWEVEDMDSYDSGWNQSVGDNDTLSAPSPWTYQTQAQLRSYLVWSKMGLYRGGGFVAVLVPDLKNASRTIEYLFRNKWLDTYTRAFFVEFTIYNANVNLFCIVTLLLETAAAGAFEFHSELHSVRLYQSAGNLYIFVMAAEIVYLLFIIYYMFVQGKLMKQQRWSYFSSKWNLLELSIILLSLSALAVFIMRTLLGDRDVTYYQNHKDQFPSFYETASADSLLQYLIAFLVLLATVKLWHLLRLNPKMHMVTATLQRAWGDISGLLIIIGIMFIAYSIACNVIYGWKISSYKTLGDALLTIISLQLGIFDYGEVLDNSPLLGGLLIGSCIMFMTFVVLNLLITAILVAFKQEQLNHKPSEEQEIVDVMLKQIYSFFGIRCKETKEERLPEPEVNSSSGLILHSSGNIKSGDLNISQTSEKPTK
ncbi:polycystin-1-like protein 2 [Platichthys flesus]|uniref:polycystin-1-like protein 2 n=1 Tax=Platichthys flesus TaxID=8260 RepID=UPI002DB9122B|nr:polycystin-1-like protein 2 [Platichthys flesus]